jgi:hypothetical protein
MLWYLGGTSALVTSEEIYEQMKELLGQPYDVLANWSLVDSDQWRLIEQSRENPTPRAKD